MTIKNFSLLFLLGICLFSSYFLLSKLVSKKDSQIEPSIEKPLFVAKGITTTHFNTEGLRTYSLVSENVEYFEAKNKALFTKPHLTTFNDGKSKEWLVNAEFAVLQDKHFLEMNKNVQFNNILPETQLKTITTEQMTLDLTSKDFWSEYKTMISGINFKTSGKRSRGNLNAQTLELMEKVKTIYESKNN